MSSLTHPPEPLQSLIQEVYPKPDLLLPLRRWLNDFQVCDRSLAHQLCKLIPNGCPFEREITLLGYTIQIPALCKLNPLYNELVSLRYQALSYLADACGEDISQYIC